MVYDPLLEILNCDMPHVELPSPIGSSRHPPCTSIGFTKTNALSKHVASNLQLRHVYHADIVERAMELLEKEVEDGNRERVELCGLQVPLNQVKMLEFYSVQRWINNLSSPSADDDTRFIPAFIEKEIATIIAFVITEPHSLIPSVFMASPSPTEHAIHVTEVKVKMEELQGLEKLIPNATTGTLWRIQRAAEVMRKLKNPIFTLIEWKYFLSMPVDVFDELVQDAISQKTTSFSWAVCSGVTCPNHTELLAEAQSHCKKYTEDAQVTLEQFNLLGSPPAAISQSSSDSSLAKEKVEAAEEKSRVSKKDGQKGKKRLAQSDDEFTPTTSEKKVALMQQLWTQGLSLDQTFLTTSTLNCTILGIRQRSNASLHISSVQYAHQKNPSLPLVWLAQCLCAFNDAIARAQQMPDNEQKGGDDNLGPLDDNDESLEDKDHDNGEQGGSGRGAGHWDESGSSGPNENSGLSSPRCRQANAQRKSTKPRVTERQFDLGEGFGQPFPVVNSLENRACAIDFISKNGTCDLRMAIFYDIYQSERPATLKSILPTNLSGGSSSNKRSSSTFTRDSKKRIRSTNQTVLQSPLLVLTEPTEEGTRGFAYRGFIPFTDYHGCKRHLRVVAKLVGTDDDRYALRHEANVYQSLRNSDILGIPLLIGLFHDIDDDLSVLVTTDTGRSLSDLKLMMRGNDELKRTLSEIHKSGWVHGDLRFSNIAQDSTGRFSIFDFDQAVSSNPDKAAQELGCSAPVL